MTIAAERVMPRYGVEPSPAPSRLARTRSILQTINNTTREGYRQTRDVVERSYQRFREPTSEIPLATPHEQIVFQKELTPDERTDSAKRFWSAVAEKKQLLDAGDPRHEEIKTALVVGGGGMGGIANGVMLEGLRKHGLLEAFDIIATDSAGTANALCALGAPDITSDLYKDLATGGKFIKGKHGGMKLNHLMDKLQEHVDPEMIYNARPNLFIGITDEFGKKWHVEAKKQTPNNLFGATELSMAAPVLNDRRRTWGRKLETDGYVSGMSVGLALEMGYNNICVLANETDEELASLGRAPLSENLLIRGLMYWDGFPRKMVHATIDRRRALQRSLRLLDHTPDINFDIVTPPTSCDPLTTDLSRLTDVQDSTRESFQQRLQEYGLIDGFVGAV